MTEPSVPARQSEEVVLSAEELAAGERFADEHDPGPGEQYAGEPVPDPWEEVPDGLDSRAVPGDPEE